MVAGLPVRRASDLVGIGQLVESDSTSVTLTEMLIRLGVVVGIYIFIGNSGIMSFGHIGFMCIGAYATRGLLWIRIGSKSCSRDYRIF